MSKSEGGDQERKRPAARRANASESGSVAPEAQAFAAAAQPGKRVSARRVAVGVVPSANTNAVAPAPLRGPAAKAIAGVRRARESKPLAVQPAAHGGARPAAVGAGQQVGFGSERAPAERQPVRPGGFARHDDDATFGARLHTDAPAAERSSSGVLSALTRRASAALRVRVEPIDEFGLDPAYELRMRPFFDAMCGNYLRVELHGAQHVPAHGRALLVSNHSRALPWDGVMLRTALRLYHETQRQPRWLVEDDQFHAPFLGTFVSRLGAVRACQENAERLLLRDELLAVFPEGRAEKSYSDRYKLQRFGRGGYVKLALRTGAPVIPVAIVGREDPLPLFDKVSALTKWVGLPLFALAPALPKLGPLGVPPIPSRWQIVIGEPIREIARQDVEATREDGLIHELNECVRSAVQHLVDRTLAASL